MKEFLQLGFQAITVDANKMDASFAGRLIDESFLSDLPQGVYSCGENEFHTFCFDGPILGKAVSFETGEKVFRENKGPANQKKYFLVL